MLISFHVFLPFYICFLVLAITDRVISTFSKKQTKPDKHIYYLWIFKLLFYGYLCIVISSIIEFFLKARDINLIISLIGFISFSCGAFLRRKAISGLGDNWSLYTVIKEGHELIENGIYKNLKHPYYLAVILELIGVCLIANAFHSLALAILVQVTLLFLRIFLEEAILIRHFGDKYKKYRQGKLL